MTAAIVDYDCLTPYGLGSEDLWAGLSAGRTAVGTCDRFRTDAFTSHLAGMVPDLRPGERDSLVMQLLVRLFGVREEPFPPDTYLIVGTTTGEIDLLEDAVANGVGGVERSVVGALGTKVARAAGLTRAGEVVSAACASSTAGLARALSLIRSGEEDCILVAAADCVSEFVFSGFSSLGALDRDPARPFDAQRRGMNIGEGAAYVLLASEKRAREMGVGVRAVLRGAGMAGDADHMTGPDRDGKGLARAVSNALRSAGRASDAVGCIAAHGTGTALSDAMEMAAFKTVFENPRPVFSVKGGTGHTMGSTGLIQCAAALRAVRERSAPPTVGLRNVSDEARGWAAPVPQRVETPCALVTNSGFGGINVAVVLEG